MNAKIAPIRYRLIQGGNVPGGHRVICEDGKKPFIPPVTECNSIPLRHSDVIVDVGAYVGTYAIRCARFPVKRVTAYEPTPRTYSILSMTKLPNLTAIQAAIVGDDRPSVDLFVSRGIGVTNSVVAAKAKAGKIVVPAVNYAKAVAGASIVKIDIEGAEYLLPIVQPSLRAVIIDFHPVPGDWIGRSKAIIRELEAAGFRAVIEPDFSNGWTRAGSWIRERETCGEYEPMTRGRLCCGCGLSIRAAKPDRSLCPNCWTNWLPKHRAGYGRAEFQSRSISS